MSDKIVYAAITVCILALIGAFAWNWNTDYMTDLARAIGKALLIVSIPLAIGVIVFFFPSNRRRR